MLIRDFEARDVPAANALTNHFILHTTVHWGADAVSDPDFLALWQQQTQRYPWLIVEVDGSLAGYCKAGAWRTREGYRHTCESTIYVEPAFQRRGVGQALYRALFDRLRAADFRMVIAGIALPNEASVRLHESLGFKLVGVFHHVGWKFDQWLDAGFWELDLTERRA